MDSKKIKNEKVYQTKKTFYDISLVEVFIKNLQKIVTNIETLENMVKSMIDEGYAKKVDLLEVQAKKASVVRMLNIAKYNRELAYQYLSFLLNQKVESIKTIYALAPVTKLSTEAILDKNLDIQKAKKGYEITAMAVELEKSDFRPMAGAFAEIGSADDTPFGDFSDHSFYTVGFKIDWNLFNGQIDKQKLEKAKVKNLKVRDQVELAKKGIALMIDKVKTEIKSLDSEIDSLEKELDFAKEVYKNYFGRYQEKIVSINDVIIKQSIEIEKTLKLQEAKNKRNEKVFLLEKIAGEEQ